MNTEFEFKKQFNNVTKFLRNVAPAKLYEEALRNELGSAISDAGALVVRSGEKTGRSPKDKRIVDHPDSSANVWWGDINIKLDPHVFKINRERAFDYLNTRPHLYVVDGYAGWDPKYRLKVRVICSRAYHALFMYNMLIRPSCDELKVFGEPDFTIYNAGSFPANRYTREMTSKTSVDVNFEEKQLVILGTDYAGEMKKGVFTVMNYLMPKQNILSMHCSANLGKDGNVSLYFGLSGTGKTTLSADPKRKLIGDDEHCWSDNGIFNIEGGCYAKCIQLSRESSVILVDDDPSIHDAWKMRFVSHALHLQHFTNPDEFQRWAILSETNDGPFLFLIDFEFAGYREKGLDLIESLSLASKSILVTSRADDPDIVAQCIQSGVRLLGTTGLRIRPFRAPPPGAFPQALPAR